MAQFTLNGLNGFTLPCKELNSQGRQANESGRAAEDTIYCIMKERGYTVKRQHPIGKGIYGHEIKVDFYVTGVAHFPTGLIIESKWQEVSGSADEKYAYMVENIQACYPCPAIVVYGGGGAKPGAIAYLKSKVGGNFAAAYSFEEFLTWVIRNL